jgi:hypothetical protein
VALPARSETVTLLPPTGAGIPARVLEQGPDSLLVAILVPTEPLTFDQLDGLVLEFVSPHGRVRLRGTTALADPREPDVLRIDGPRSVEVVQQRDYVRIRSARPVLVYAGADRMEVQSYTVDISGGGLLLAGPDSLRVGDEVSFQLSLTAGVASVSGTGRVVRIDSERRRAVEFETISELDRRRLVRFIFECQRDERRRGLELGDR